ncbi:MAG: tRNA (adenosine(37)-N6)-threonylcarbamoyltransferase complex dimerization subunit type 1 TsaB, partial [Firmicutes bacterium]|nr:tRNA (adenosine(37)-N6)-threonylcarbamoyltransferase complex dimerization subunit type 1 TsaB [Bacillota bacterium]
KLLAIETTGAKASAALMDEAGKITIQGSDETMNHLQHLIPMIQQLMTNCALSINDITGILVSEGPGSFTGIRIGMATAKGLAQALNVPIVGVPTLRSFAYHFQRTDVIACPVFDARREQVYSGAYLWNGTEAVQLVCDGAYDLKEHLAQIQAAIAGAAGSRAAESDGITTVPANVLFFGDGLDRYEAQICQWAEAVKEQGIEVEFAPVERRYQEASSIAFLGRQMMEQGKAKQFGEMEPVYLRQAEAQRKLEERLAQMK